MKFKWSFSFYSILHLDSILRPKFWAFLQISVSQKPQHIHILIPIPISWLPGPNTFQYNNNLQLRIRPICYCASSSPLCDSQKYNSTSKSLYKPIISCEETSTLIQLPCRTDNPSTLIDQIIGPFSSFLIDLKIPFTVGLGKGERSSKLFQLISPLNQLFFPINSLLPSVIETEVLKLDFDGFWVWFLKQ